MADFDVNISDGTSVEVVITPANAGGGGVSDHGELTGLSDDDHTQYHTDARGDTRYYQKSEVYTKTEGDSRYLQSVPGSYATDTEVATAISDHEAALDPHTGYQKESEKGSASGYASLDSGGTVPDAQIPSAIARDSEVSSAAASAASSAVSTHEAAPDPHTGYQKESEKDQNSGYAGLNSSGRVPIARLASGTPDGTKFIRDDGTLVTPSSSGGNIAGAYDIEANTSYTDAGMSDEFDTGTLNAQWTIDPGLTTPATGTIDPYTNAAAHVLDVTTRDKGLLVQPRANATEDMMRIRQTGALSAGESIVVAVTMPYIGGSASADNYHVHIDMSNGSAWNGTTSNPMRGFFINGTSTIAIRAWNYNTGGALTTGSHTYDFNIYGQRMYFRVSRVSNTYYYSYSFDGTGWNILANETLATHFTHFWLTAVNRQSGAGQFVVVPFHWVRHVASTAYDLW